MTTDCLLFFLHKMLLDFELFLLTLKRSLTIELIWRNSPFKLPIPIGNTLCLNRQKGKETIATEYLLGPKGYSGSYP